MKNERLHHDLCGVVVEMTLPTMILNEGLVSDILELYIEKELVEHRRNVSHICMEKNIRLSLKWLWVKVG